MSFKNNTTNPIAKKTEFNKINRTEMDKDLIRFLFGFLCIRVFVLLHSVPNSSDCTNQIAYVKN